MTLDAYRKEIDCIDDQLAGLFSQRMHIAAEIAAYKKDNGIAVLDAGREQEKLAALQQKCPDFPEDIVRLYETIFTLSRNYQERLMEP